MDGIKAKPHLSIPWTLGSLFLATTKRRRNYWIIEIKAYKNNFYKTNHQVRLTSFTCFSYYLKFCTILGGTSGYLSGSKSKKSSSDTIHNYLYENAKQKDTLQKLNQALVEESFKSLTFNPSIPAASKEIILQKYQQKQQQLQLQDQDSIAGTQNVIINYLCWLQSTLPIQF